jgi:hypothetical protein
MRGRTGVWLALLVVLSLAYAVFAHWLSTAQGLAALGPWARGLPWIYFLQHVAMFSLLAAWFGVSLRPGREARVTRVARHAGDLLDDAGPTEQDPHRRSVPTKFAPGRGYEDRAYRRPDG